MKRFILTGDREAGKTTFCRSLYKKARTREMTVAGIITLTSRKDELRALDLFSSETRRLAEFNKSFQVMTNQGNRELSTRQWIFDPSAITWGNSQIMKTPKCNLFILDEAGILEFEREQGWTAGLSRIDLQKDDCSIVVVRPELISQALERWIDSEVLMIDKDRNPHHEEALMMRILANRY
ncbi:hypothetical protein EXM22_16390 [Oceanispirochaeta crateris]|uniref:Nucleotide kinase n=1 Tax=Oceanispirochaeta crateris TaxID=2518645 RepID=A0A5C1QNF4_9SPIO|nr:nucleoside-triphosphatase [Oceanispirochaeta crateris]QEN09483.1 hypothetical protein EXM22_16390 [Oceanispirochaeta crateris]